MIYVAPTLPKRQLSVRCISTVRHGFPWHSSEWLNNVRYPLASHLWGYQYPPSSLQKVSRRVRCHDNGSGSPHRMSWSVHIWLASTSRYVQKGDLQLKYGSSGLRCFSPSVLASESLWNARDWAKARLWDADVGGDQNILCIPNLWNVCWLFPWKGESQCHQAWWVRLPNARIGMSGIFNWRGTVSHGELKAWSLDEGNKQSRYPYRWVLMRS